MKAVTPTAAATLTVVATTADSSNLTRLHPDDLAAIICAVQGRAAEGVEPIAPGQMWASLAQLAVRFGRSLEYLKKHKDELMSVPITPGNPNSKRSYCIASADKWWLAKGDEEGALRVAAPKPSIAPKRPGRPGRTARKLTPAGNPVLVPAF